MTARLTVTTTGVVCGSDSEVREGLLAWVTLVLNDALIVDSVTLRRTASGRLRLSFPEKTDGRGNRHSIVRPLSSEAREELERQVFQQLGLTGEVIQ